MLSQDLLDSDADICNQISENSQTYSLKLFELIKQKSMLHQTATRVKEFDRETYRAEKIANYIQAVGRLAI